NQRPRPFQVDDPPETLVAEATRSLLRPKHLPDLLHCKHQFARVTSFVTAHSHVTGNTFDLQLSRARERAKCSSCCSSSGGTCWRGSRKATAAPWRRSTGTMSRTWPISFVA